MEQKKKSKRAIPVAVKSKSRVYGPTNVENRIRKHSGSKSEKSPADNHGTGSGKSALEIKGPFNPDIVAKFRNSNEQPKRPVRRSSSESRKERENRAPVKAKDDIDLHHGSHHPKSAQVLKEINHLPRLHGPVKRITRRRSAEDQAKLDELEGERDVLNGTVEALKSRVDQYESVLKNMKVDPASLKELLLNEENITKHRAEASKNVDELKELLQQNLLIANTINQHAQEILTFPGCT